MYFLISTLGLCGTIRCGSSTCTVSLDKMELIRVSFSVDSETNVSPCLILIAKSITLRLVMNLI